MLKKLAAIDRFHLQRLLRYMEFLRDTREGQGGAFAKEPIRSVLVDLAF